MGSGASKDNVRPPTPVSRPATPDGTDTPGGPLNIEGRVPTPGQLKEKQKQYAARGENLKKDSKGIPPPHPPRKFKHEIFKLEKYRHIDQHAINVPRHLRDGTFKTLVDYLMQPCRTDMAKVRVVIRWIAAQNLGEITPLTAANSGSPFEYLKNCKYSIVSHATIFQLLMNETDVPCETIRGSIKAARYDVGDNSTIGRSAWNVVCIDGDWRPLNVNWICQSVSGVQAGNYRLLETQGVSVNQMFSSNEQMHYGQCKEQHFLPDPHSFIYTHFPEEQKWQLLAQPLTEEDYQRMAFCRSPFFEHNLDLGSHSECVLTASLGQIRILLLVRPGVKKEFMYKFYQSEGTLDSKTGAGATLSRFVFVERHEERNRLATIRFGVEGQFQLELYCKTRKHDDFEHIGTYTIHCLQLPPDKSKRKQLPPNSRSEWGPGDDSREVGLVPVSHTGGLVEAEDGEVEVRFKLEQGVEFMHKLESNNLSTGALQNFVVHHVENGEVVFRVKLPRKGEYTLSVFTRKRGTGFRNVCNYLVDARRCALFPTPFPMFEFGQFGVGQNGKDVDLTPKNHDASYLTVEKESTLEFTTSQAMLFEWTLKLQDIEEQEDMERFVFVEYPAPTEPVFKFKFPKPGTYHFALFGRVLETGNTDESKLLANYIFEVKEADIGCFAFPKPNREWRRGYRLVEPLIGQLLPETQYDIIIEAPSDIDRLMLMGRSNVAMQKREDGTWGGAVNTGRGGGNIRLQRKPDAKEPILSFELLTADGASDHKQEAEKVRKQLENKLEKRKKEEEDDEKEQQRLEAAMKKQQQDEKKKKEKAEEARRKKDDQVKQQRTADDKLKDAGMKAMRRRLQFAMDSGDRSSLVEAIREFKETYGDDCKDQVLKEAEQYLRVMDAKNTLHAAMAGGSYEKLRDAIDAVTRLGIESQLGPVMREAQERLVMLEKIHQLSLRVLKLEPKTLQELKQYAKPTQGIHDVLMAALLLLGEHELRTRVWRRCQKYITPYGKTSFVKKVKAYNPSRLEPEIWARAKELLLPYDKDTVARNSAGAAAIYLWARAVVDARDSDLGAMSPEPASPERQLELLHSSESLDDFKEDEVETKATPMNPTWND